MLVFVVVVMLLIIFSISVYIMCVILCYFSALSRRVGALEISIIINYYSQRPFPSVCVADL